MEPVAGTATVEKMEAPNHQHLDRLPLQDRITLVLFAASSLAVMTASASTTTPFSMHMERRCPLFHQSWGETACTS